ncbi:Serine/threonine protein kinase [Cryptosporangium aurantiacum]|uniref:non-specific serine/threonine protein kinase n=1 Tax=Cryptosporangium aurantiacum TaxID=134849 RepID=A0A1M7NIQ0_9ACTN|nr:Serine/threonine protein kinase [Cryptosporangium aurantiacum]
MYRARQDSIGREVALKIDTRSLESERDRRRFLREAEAAGRMSGHPNVVNVYDAGVTEDNHPYLVMELCTGGSYASRLRQHGPLSPVEVRDVGVKIADALQAAHDNGILHRDVKPGNILINRYGVPGLADFGLAALPDPSRELSVTIEALTPAYAPPEVFRMEPPTPLGDQYALGASLYALLSGRPPRWPETGTPSLATMVMMLDEPVPDIPGVPASFSNVLRQAMAPYAEDRYPSAAELRDALASMDLDADTGSRHAFGAVPPVPSSGPPSSGAPSSGAPSSGAPSFGAPSSGPPASGAAAAGSVYGGRTGSPSGPPSGPSSGPPSSGGGYGAASSGPVTGGWQQGGLPPAPHSGPPAPSAPYNQPRGGANPTSVFPSSTYAPGKPEAGGYQPPYGPPPGGFNAPPPGGPPSSRGTKRVLVIVGIVVAALIVASGIGLAVTGLLGGSDDPPRPPATTEPVEGPRTTGPPQPSPTRSGELPGFPLDQMPTSTAGANAFDSACEVAVLAATGSGMQAQCPAKPECWRDQSNGSVRARGCTNNHTWETYVIGTLSSSTGGTDPKALQADPHVQFLCSSTVLTAVLTATGQDAGGWRTTASAFGATKFRCLAGKGTDELRRAYFVR